MTKNKNVETPVKENKKSAEKQQESTRDVIIRVWRVIVASSIAFAIVIVCVSDLTLAFKLFCIPAGIQGAWLLVKR